ncbi:MULTISPECIES: fumarylacetoacetate hydrolase family protein [Micrococcaceae]|uniref:fumarylacetoacetate hydrolase family protein n=1 Tax=Micrococcaceae TaxID=1268 RepID=UPI001036D226|nr:MULTISPECIES: fumarylacetoacetate hydrolase family protein [Micrococcaceae]TAP28303.1 FAA hydrolase family protein [Arthrobacter sp. S41]UXN32900.1 fumarylacetoacetate hydrolase family protein [Glutamicibacter sp. M10]
MKLATLRLTSEPGHTTAAVIEDGRAYYLDNLDTVQRFLRLDEPTQQEVIARALVGESIAEGEAHYAPLIPNPSKIYCIGLNYKSHAAEVGQELPKYPTVFAKFASSLCGANDEVEIPVEDHRVDYEAELAIIIGTPGRRIAEEDAASHIAGYAVSSDVSMRGFQGRSSEWLQGKIWDHSTPLGPWLVTPDELDPAAKITSAVNGVIVQEGQIDDLIFNAEQLVSYLSTFNELQPGDVILTGTPAGVALGRRDENGRHPWLKHGDVLETRIDGLGVARTTFNAAQH